MKISRFCDMCKVSVSVCMAPTSYKQAVVVILFVHMQCCRSSGKNTRGKHRGC